MFDNMEMMHHLDFQKIISQIDRTNDYLFGDNVNVLILADRLIGCAEGLKRCLDCYSDITVYFINNSMEFQNIPVIPDFIIIVGYLANTKNYEIIERVKPFNKYVLSVFYARIDECILSCKQKYQVDECFSRDLQISYFIKLLKEKYKVVKLQKS